MNPLPAFAERDDHPVSEGAALLDAVLTVTSDAVIVTDLLGRVTLLNPAAEQLFGHPAHSLVGRALDRLLPADQRVAHRAHVAQWTASAGLSLLDAAGALGQADPHTDTHTHTHTHTDTQTHTQTHQHPHALPNPHRHLQPHGPAGTGGRVAALRADGRTLTLDSWLTAAEVDGQTRLFVFFRDTAAQTEAGLARGRERLALAELSQRLLRQEEDTARRLGKALHDGLAQTLAAIRLLLDAGAYDKLDALVEEADNQARQALFALRPAPLEDHGLVAALRDELQYRMPLHAGVELTLESPPELDAQRWPAAVEYAAFMVAREAFHNAWRHAGAAHIRLSLCGNADQLSLSVQDDGRGLPTERRRRSRPGHFGVVDMHERAEAVGATLVLDSAEGAGTHVHFCWPAARPPQPEPSAGPAP